MDAVRVQNDLLAFRRMYGRDPTASEKLTRGWLAPGEYDEVVADQERYSYPLGTPSLHTYGASRRPPSTGALQPPAVQTAAQPAPTVGKESLDFEPLLAAIGGKGISAGRAAELRSIDPYLATMQRVGKEYAAMPATPQRTLNREERIQQAIDANPQVSREDISLSDSDKNQTLMRLGLSMLAGGGRDFSETLGKSGLVAQDYAQQRKDLTLAEKKEQRAERLRQADALLRAAGEDTSEYNQQEILKRAERLQMLGAEFGTAKDQGTLVEGDNRVRVANAGVEAQRAALTAQLKEAQLKNPRVVQQVIDYVSDVQANPGKYDAKTQAQAAMWASVLNLTPKTEGWKPKELGEMVELLLNRGDLDTPTKFTEAGIAYGLPEDTIRSARASRFGAVK